MAELTESIWERRPADYESHAAVSPYNALYDRPAVLNLLGDVGGRLILDAGCGPGLYAEELLARGAEVIAFDRSTGMIDLARTRLGERASLRVHDLAEPLDWIATGTCATGASPSPPAARSSRRRDS